MLKQLLFSLTLYGGFVIVLFAAISAVQQVLPCGWLTSSTMPLNRSAACSIVLMESLR